MLSPGSVIAEPAAAGLAALKVDHRDKPSEARERCIAAEHDLFGTGPNDYHGRGSPTDWARTP